jgi:DNA-directed RNA polymerase specialized sigma24 family protein
VRRVAFDHAKGQRTQIPTDDADLDEAEPFVDAAEASLERSLVAQAFASLPERWQAVLWYTEVEQARPAEVALLLGISPNSVAALRYRAREGLRQAYLQAHVSHARPECQQVVALLAATCAAPCRGGTPSWSTRHQPVRRLRGGRGRARHDQ